MAIKISDKYNGLNKQSYQKLPLSEQSCCSTPKTFQMTWCHFSHFTPASNAHILSFFILLDFIFGGIQIFNQVSRVCMISSHYYAVSRFTDCSVDFKVELRNQYLLSCFFAYGRFDSFYHMTMVENF